LKLFKPRLLRVLAALAIKRRKTVCRAFAGLKVWLLKSNPPLIIVAQRADTAFLRRS
jgi:hypothetical protein